MENPEISERLTENELTDSCEIGVNGAGTGEQNDTKLTQCRSSDVPEFTYFIRDAEGIDRHMTPNQVRQRQVERSCSCHPDDKPPEPCAQRHATSECKRVEGLRKLVDIVWLHATENAHWPSTKTADMLIARYIEQVSAVEAFHKSSDPSVDAPVLRMEDEVQKYTWRESQLIMQAQIWKQEARTANATIAEIYQLCSGATGEPGNWNGAEPVRQRLAELSREPQ
jgi:hypothetical protein